MHIRCLGPLTAAEEGRDLALGGPRQRLVLAHLLVHANHTVSVDQLIARVWGEDPPPAVRSSLHSVVSRLRTELGADRIEGGGGGYALRVADDEIDRLRFEALVARGRRLRPTDPAAAATVLHDALDLWHGPPFADLTDAASLQPEITRLEELRATAREDHAAARLDCDDDHELITELEAMTTELPLRERRWELLMTALYRAGRQADALAAYDRARTLLADELGIDPAPELRALHERVLRQDPSLRSAGPVLKGYRLLDRVGAGGFGVVWRASQPGTDRTVAVKVVHPALADRGHVIRRFEADAQRVARIEHPHIAPLYDFWREPGGAYLVTRFLGGGDLADRRAGPSDRAARVRIADDVVQAVATAHRQGVVHGDITPWNILFDDDGNAFLTDFAIAGGGAADDRDRPYAAPERIDGDAADRRSDVFALGVLLSELLSDLPGNDSDDLQRVLRRAADPGPGRRHPDAGALLVALRAAVGATAAPTGTRRMAAPRNPYKGLRAFGEADAGDFFGRRDVVAHLLGRLREDGPQARFLAIVGPSGSGKSSVARAGLVPALRAGALPRSADWYIAQMVPGDRPFEALATALRRVAVQTPDDLPRRLHDAPHLDAVVARLLPDDGELVVVIDQFEELFTLADEATRQAFLDAVVTATTDPDGRVRVIVTLRADFFDRPLEHRGLALLMRRRTEVVTPLSADELERAVVGPAELVGVDVERTLVAQMIADVADQPSALPLLQFALTELFDRRPDNRLTAGVYQTVGGVAGALARRADAVYAGLPDEAQEAARQAFLRLVTPGEGADDTRRRATVDEIRALTPDSMAPVLDAFGAARLLAFDRDPESRAPTVEIAHEALLHRWRRLAGWIAAARDDLRVHRRLQAATAEWLAADRDPSFLTTGTRLVQLERWRATSRLTLGEPEREHLDASVAARDRASAEDAARRTREAALERRSVQRLRILVAVLACAALIAGGLTVYAVTQARRAAVQTLRTQRQARVATARELAAAAVASVSDDPERGMLLAIRAIGQTREVDGTVLPEAEEALHRAVTSSRIVRRVPDIGGAVDWGRDGGVFVTEGPEQSGVVDIRDAETGASVRSWHGHDIDVNDVAFSPDGALLATTGDDGTARVWDPDTGDEVARVTGDGASEVWAPSFSADGSRMAAASPDGGWVAVVDTDAGRTITRVDRDDEPWATALDPEGGEVAVASRAVPVVAVFDVRTGAQRFTLDGHDDTASDVAWSPDGSRIATASFDGTVRIWDGRTGRHRLTLFGPGPMRDVDWSTDGRRLAAGSDDGTAVVWRLADRGAQQEVSVAGRDTSNGVRGVALSPDSRRLLTGDIDVTAAVIWDVSDAGDAEWVNLPIAARVYSPVAFTPDGDGVVATGPDGVVEVHDAATGATRREMADHGAPGVVIESLDVDPSNGRIAAAVNAGGPPSASVPTAHGAVTWEAAGRPAMTFADDAWVMDVAWSPAGHMLAFASLRGSVRVVDRSGEQVAELRQDPDTIVGAIEFSPDGRLLAAADFRRNRFEGQVELWDWRNGRRVQTLDVFTQDIAFAPDGRHLATAELSGRARVWDVRTGRPVASARRRSGVLYAVAYAPDGRTIATAGADRAIHLWDPRTGRERLALTGAQGPVGSVAFSPDGTRLASGGQDGLGRVWALDLDDLIAIARNELTRELSTEECRQYLHADTCPAA